MLYIFLAYQIIAVLSMLQRIPAFGVITEELCCISGCNVIELNERSEIFVKCIEYDANFTPKSLPKNTTYLKVYGVKDLPTNIPLFLELKNLTKLLLTNNAIRNISKIMFEGLEKLIHLGLKMNFIKDVSSDTFTNTLNLEILDLSDNYILSIESITPSLRYLRNLKYLFLYNNRLIRYLKDNDFVLLQNSSLEMLDISSCVIKFIESNVFKPLKSLNSLNISYNPLPEEGLRNISLSLEMDTLRDLNAKAMVTEASYFSCRFLTWLQKTGVTSLDLSENRFICFPKGRYKYLHSLILNKCSIFEHFPISFTEMPNLEYLEIKEHRLLGIDKEFKTNTRLKFLDLSHFIGIETANSFKIAEYAFENQSELNFLYLQDVPIKGKLKRYMLHNLTKLENLSLYKCRILAVECNAFETLENLVFLDLSLNRITELSTCSFYGLVALKNINLSNNLISFIGESHPFEYMSQLEILTLNSNKIVQFPPGGLQKLSNLLMIRLSDNLMQPWHSTLLPQNGKNMVLLLDKNAISYFTAEMFKDISKLDVFDFSNNPINCSDCSILELRKWMMNNTSMLRKSDLDGEYVCSNSDVNIIEANLTLHYCFPEESDIVKTMCIALSPILFTAVVFIIVWYRWSWNIKYCFFLIRLNAMKYKDNIDSRQYTFDACVFYCEADLKWIRTHLVPSLENSNSSLRLCLPDRNFQAGVPILDSILSAINNSRSTIIILSNKCLDDSWCLNNMQMAQNMMVEKSRSGLIVILLEDIPKDKLKKDLQYVLSTRTCIWWTENKTGQKLFWERLRLAILRPLDRGVSAHIT